MRLARVAFVSLWFVACSTSPTPAPDAGLRDYTLVLLRTGERKEPLTEAESTKVFQGHFANMGRLAREGHLVLAGPYGKNRSAPDLRGVFVLATGDRERARALAETDPGFQAGEFRLEFHALATAAKLREQVAVDLAREEAAKASGKTPKPGENIRGYVLLKASAGDAAMAALRGLPSVLMLARLDGTGAFAVLDAANRAAAETLLAPLAPQLGTIQLDEWFASALLVDLPKR